jgi:hypothetical protein
VHRFSQHSIFWTPSDDDDDEHTGVHRQLHRTISSEESCGDGSDSSVSHEWNSDELSDGESDADIATTATKSKKHTGSSSRKRAASSRNYADSSSESDADVAITAATSTINMRKSSSSKHTDHSRKRAASSSRYSDSSSDDVMIIELQPVKQQVVTLSDSDDQCDTTTATTAAATAAVGAAAAAAATGTAAATAAAASTVDVKPKVKLEAPAERKADRQQRRTRSSSAKQAAHRQRARTHKQHIAPAHVLAARAREQRLLREAAQSLQVCDNPLDSILDALRGTGTESLVGEVTGRQKERVRDNNGNYHYQVSS